MKRKILLSIAIFAIAISGYAQTAAGSCLTSVNTPSYINCGNNAAFNMSGAFTIEAWINPFTFGDDRKLVGKTNTSFNSGFVFGLENGIYTEIWQPARTELRAGTLPSFFSWVHVAITFNPGNTITGYINGQMVGSAPVAASNLATNTDDLIIGIAPWDFGALMFLGQMDEIRFWNIERTATEVQADMHKELTGNETNLIALYNLNTGSGSMASNSTVVTGIDGTITGSSWNASYAVIGSSTMHTQNDVNSIWLGMNNDPVGDLRFANTSNGLSIITAVDSTNYIIYGHDNSSGITANDLPQVALDENFQRTERLWYVEAETPGEDFKSRLVFDLADASGGGTSLSTTQAPENYTVFHRTGTSGEFTAVAGATVLNTGKVVFDSVNITTGYYAIGVGDSAIVGSVGMEENIFNQVTIYPNPTKSILTIDLKEAFNTSATIKIINSVGQEVLTRKINKRSISLNVSDLKKGIYTIKINSQKGSTVKKVSIQ